MTTRIPLLPETISEPAELVSAIRARRGGGLLELDRMLLHSPALARGWSALLKEVRTNLQIDPKLRELAICVVAQMNGAHYEMTQHAPEYLKHGGTQAEIGIIEQGPDAVLASPLFDAKAKAVLALTVGMTREVAVSDAVFEAAKAAIGGEQNIVELVGTIATYNLVSRFLVALKL